MGKKINYLENKVSNMEIKLEEIKDLLIKNGDNTVHRKVSRQAFIPSSNIWQNKEKLETIKAPPAKSVLVYQKTGE